MKTSRARAGMWWLLLLLLTSYGVDGTKDLIEVPKQFENLEYARSVITNHERRPEDLRSGRENLQRWIEAIKKGDQNAIQQVASSSTNVNNAIDFEEIPKLDAFDHQIIIQLDSSDTVQTASNSLYNKETAEGHSKTLLEWNEKSGQLKALKSKGTNTIEITENTKVTVVGHGEPRVREVYVGGKTADQLAEVIAKLKEQSSPLHWSSKQGSVKEISLVSCNVGAGEKGESFVKKILIELKNRRITVGSVSARTVYVIVGEDGRKVTIDSDSPEWESRHNPAHKRKFYLDNNNQLREVSDTSGRSPEWQKIQDLAVEYDPLARDNIPIFDLYYKDQNNVYRIPDDHLAQFIKDSITQRFGSEVNKQHLKTETLNVYKESGSERVEISTVEGLGGLLNNIKDIIQTANSKRMQLLQASKEKLLEFGIQVNNNIKIKDTWRQVQEQVETNWNTLTEIRTQYDHKEHGRKLKPQRAKYNIIRTYRDEIEGEMAKSVKYFRFKDYIYSINMKDFYVNLYGTTNQNHITEVSEYIKKINNRDVNTGHVAYSEIEGMINGRDFVQMTKLWVSGQQDQIGKINPYDGMGVLATHVSEAVRNPDMFITNRQLWDLHPTWREFIYHDPMTRGRTWSGNHAAIGLDYETNDQNIMEQIREETLSVMKQWTTSKHGNPNFKRNLEPGHSKPIDMALNLVKAKMGDVIKPLDKINFERPRQIPLDEDIRNDLLSIEEQGRKDSLETEFHLNMMEDRKQLVEKITEKIREQTPADLSRYQKIKLVERHGEGVKIVLQNKQNPSETKEILMPDMKDTLNSEGVLDSYFGESHLVSGKINHALGIYGTLMGFQAANQMFAEGRKWEGGVMLAQGAHVTGINAAVNDFVGNIAQKSIAMISSRLEKTVAKEFKSAMSKAGSVAREVPVLSAAFTVFNIYEDLKQDSPIGIADAMLDGTIFITALAGPEMLPATVASTIIRLGIDPLFHEIRRKLDALPPDASELDKFEAVIKGVGLTIRDVAKRDVSNVFLDIWNQITFFIGIYNVYYLEEEHRKSMDTVHELQTAENYFKIFDEKLGGKCHRRIDFTQGKKSDYGGNLKVELTDRRSMIVTLTDPVTSQKKEEEISFEKDCETEDLVLGIGEAVNIKMQQKTATMFWLIPRKTEEVISSMTPDDRSLYGTYIGNAKANRFFAVQQNIIKGFSYTLDKYHYKLYGRDGNDIFFLGPQMSFAHGGNGQDIYYIPLGGKAEICNHATDRMMDHLVFKITFQEINGRKIENDLKLFYNNLHEIHIKNWFDGEEYQHMSFKSSDGVFFNVGKVHSRGKVDLQPVTLDFSTQEKFRNIDLQNPPWKTVVAVIGTDFDDIINGNQLNNVILGRGGANTMSGREGKDMYIIQEKKSCDTIDNFAKDEQIDIVELSVDFQSLKVAITPTYSLKIWDSNGKICVIIKDWKKGLQWQHVIFKTKDFVVFQVSDTAGKPEISPLMRDYSDSKEGVNIKLNSIPGNEHIMTVIGSSHFDTIQGNSKANVIKKGRGGGNLMGGDGSDMYIIECSSDTIHINNYAEDGAMDILYVKEEYSKLRFQQPKHKTSLEISSENCKIILEDWFKSEQYRHLQIWTEDRVVFSIPKGTEPVIDAVDKSRDTLPMDVFDTRSGIYKGVTKIIGPPRSIKIYGNEKDNYIDPGTNGAWLNGGEGRDTYQLRKNYEGNYDIDNYATDHKVDYLVLDIRFRHIQNTVEKTASSTKQIVLTAPSVAKWRCRLLEFGKDEAHRHLIVQTNDVWFTFSKDTLEIQPLFSDYRLLNKVLHLDLSEGILRSLPTVYGSLQEKNDIHGNALNNIIIGGKNEDILYGEDGNDVLQGSSGEDYLSGGPGDDQIHGGEGDDRILCEAGNDLIYPGPGADAVYGGTGSDTLLFLGNVNSKSGVSVNLHDGVGLGADAEGDTYFGIENILGTSYDDILIGNDNNNYLNGAGGNDLIQPMGGYDVLHGGEGKDVYGLEDATGTKMINNFAMDGKEDQVYIDNSDTLEIRQLKSKNDHEVSFYYSTEPDARLTVLFKNWYVSEKHRHLRLFRKNGGEVKLSV